MKLRNFFVISPAKVINDEEAFSPGAKVVSIGG